MTCKALAATLTLATLLPAHAALTTNPAALAGPTSEVDFDAFDGLVTTGPQLVAPGLSFTGDNGSVLGANIADLGDNGLWGAGKVFAATGFIGELRFTFTDGQVSQGAGAVVNHFALSPLPFQVVVSAFGVGNQMLETHNFTVTTAQNSLNEGTFLGIIRPQADIQSISFKANGLALDDLVFTAAVPEPRTYAMLLAGLATICLVARRRAR